MTAPRLRLPLAALALALPLGLHAQAPAPTADQLKSWIEIREQRVDLLRDELKQTDARIESRLDTIVDSLKAISDSKDSKTKVARMKEDTGKRLAGTIRFYEQKRSDLREELRNPRLRLTEEEKRKLLSVMDARIEKRAQQVIALHKSMPPHEDHERYRSTDNGWYGNEYERNEEFEQNRRLTSRSNSQRDALVRGLEKSISRLDQQIRSLRVKVAAETDPAQRKVLAAELAKDEELLAQRRAQRLEVLKPSSTATHTVALKEAMDLDKALQSAINDLKRDFNTLFSRYNAYISELSTLHATEAALAARNAR